MAAMLIDSDVLVWLTRGHVGAAKRLHALDPWRISTVTYIELAQGCRDKAELARLKKGPRGVEPVQAELIWIEQQVPRTFGGKTVACRAGGVESRAALPEGQRPAVAQRDTSADARDHGRAPVDGR
jgi:hypothetical protein